MGVVYIQSNIVDVPIGNIGTDTGGDFLGGSAEMDTAFVILLVCLCPAAAGYDQPEVADFPDAERDFRALGRIFVPALIVLAQMPKIILRPLIFVAGSLQSKRQVNSFLFSDCTSLLRPSTFSLRCLMSALLACISCVNVNILPIAADTSLHGIMIYFTFSVAKITSVCSERTWISARVFVALAAKRSISARPCRKKSRNLVASSTLGSIKGLFFIVVVSCLQYTMKRRAKRKSPALRQGFRSETFRDLAVAV